MLERKKETETETDRERERERERGGRGEEEKGGGNDVFSVGPVSNLPFARAIRDSHENQTQNPRRLRRQMFVARQRPVEK